MQGRCPNCGADVPPKARPGGLPKVYCTRACKQRAKERRQPPPYTPPRVTLLNTCASCGTCTPRPRFCTDRCKRRVKERRKYQRTRAYVPPRATALCGQPGCVRPHRARNLCGTHYNQQRRAEGYDVASPVFTLNGIVRTPQRPAARSQRVLCRVAVGLLARCPSCHATMGATALHVRVCLPCEVSVELNPDEVSWLVTEARTAAREKGTHPHG